MYDVDVYEEATEALPLESFVLEHHGLVKKIALHMKKRLPSYIELEDLIQSGFVGLLEARSHYKNNMGATFETFASLRVHGAMIDFLRKNSWANRDAMKYMKQISEAIRTIEQRCQHAPTTDEIIKEMKTSPTEHYKMCQQISVCHMANIDLIEADIPQAEDNANPQFLNEHEQMKGAVMKAINLLPEREKVVLSLYYVEEFTFRQIVKHWI